MDRKGHRMARAGRTLPVSGESDAVARTLPSDPEILRMKHGRRSDIDARNRSDFRSSVQGSQTRVTQPRPVSQLRMAVTGFDDRGEQSSDFLQRQGSIRLKMHP